MTDRKCRYCPTMLVTRGKVCKRCQDLANKVRGKREQRYFTPAVIETRILFCIDRADKRLDLFAEGYPT